MSEWDPTHAVELWSSDKRWRTVDDDQAPPRKKQRVGQEAESSDSVTDSPVTLDDWEEWALSV